MEEWREAGTYGAAEQYVQPLSPRPGPHLEKSALEMRVAFSSPLDFWSTSAGYMRHEGGNGAGFVVGAGVQPALRCFQLPSRLLARARAPRPGGNYYRSDVMYIMCK